LPRDRLREDEIKVREQSRVRQIPSSTRIVGHRIDRPWDVVVSGDVTVFALVECVVL
jgi:hypothetical protein